MPRLRRRAWHSSTIENEDGETFAIAATTIHAEQLIRPYNLQDELVKALRGCANLLQKHYTAAGVDVPKEVNAAIVVLAKVPTE